MTTETTEKVKGYTGIPDMPLDYWQFWRHSQPLLKMGTPTRPKTWIIGFNGPRGGGKSGSTAYFSAAQWLLRGFPVYTIPESYSIRIPIIWNHKVYTFHTEPLDIEKLIMFDPSLENSLVVAEEANIQLADSHRSMSNKNLGISDYAQQCRHHSVSMIYNTISASWIDPRLRQLTDILIYCTDAANSQSGEEAKLEEGEYTHWTVMDNSGLLTGIPYEVEPLSYPWTLRLKDFWGIYNTHNIADTRKARSNISFSNNRIEIQVNENPDADNRRDFAEGIEMVLNAYAKNAIRNDRGEVLIKSNELWATLGIGGNRAAISEAGVILSGMGIGKKVRQDGNYYDLTPMVR